MTRRQLETQYADLKRQYDQLRACVIAIARDRGPQRVPRALFDDQAEGDWVLVSDPIDNGAALELSAENRAPKMDPAPSGLILPSRPCVPPLSMRARASVAGLIALAGGLSDQ